MWLIDFLIRKKLKASFFYNGGYVTRAMLEKAIDFIIILEPDPDDPNSDKIYSRRCKVYSDDIEMAEDAIRQYGDQIEPKTLENMQEEFYAITNSTKYRQTLIHNSVAYSCLNHGWDRIGPWRA